MIAALKPGAFADSLCKKRLANKDELRHHIAKYIQMEELFEYRDKVKGDQKKPESNKEKLKPMKERDFKRQPRQPTFALYISLPESRARILEEAFNAKILVLPLLAGSHS